MAPPFFYSHVQVKTCGKCPKCGLVMDGCKNPLLLNLVLLNDASRDRDKVYADLSLLDLISTMSMESGRISNLHLARALGTFTRVVRTFACCNSFLRLIVRLHVCSSQTFFVILEPDAILICTDY